MKLSSSRRLASKVTLTAALALSSCSTASGQATTAPAPATGISAASLSATGAASSPATPVATATVASAATQARVTTTTKGSTPKAALTVPAPRSPLESLPPTRNVTPTGLTATETGGGYTQVTIPGRASGHTGTAYVWFPPGYTAKANAKRTYPVIEVFHGFKPSPLGYFSYYHLDRLMADEVKAGRMREAVIVLPDWAPNNQDTECVDGGGTNVRMETWLTQDVPAWIAQTYRVARARTSWAGYGASTGGWCGMMAAALHPQTFGAAVSLGGQGYPEFDPPYIPFQPDSALGRRYDLTRVLREQAPPVALWMLTSATDKYSYPTSKTMIDATREPTSVTALVLPSGRHHPTVWLPYFPDSIKWLGTNVPGFAADKSAR